MFQDDLDGEYTVIKNYKSQIKMCDEIGDTTTRLMLEEIPRAQMKKTMLTHRNSS